MKQIFALGQPRDDSSGVRSDLLNLAVSSLELIILKCCCCCWMSKPTLMSSVAASTARATD